MAYAMYNDRQKQDEYIRHDKHPRNPNREQL